MYGIGNQLLVEVILKKGGYNQFGGGQAFIRFVPMAERECTNAVALCRR